MAFSFGAPSTGAPSAGGGFSFGAPSTAAPGFGAPAASKPTSLFGTATASVAPNTSAPPAFGSLGAATPVPAAAQSIGGFGAGTPAKTTAVAATSAGFGGFGTAVSSAVPAVGTFGAPTSSVAPSLGFGVGLTAVSATPAVSAGLGGNTSAGGLGGGTGGLLAGTGTGVGHSTGLQEQGKGEVGKSGKESMIPQELAITVESLKQFIKEEKDTSSEISHLSDKMFTKIKEDSAALGQLVSVLATGIQNNRTRLEKLKMDSGQELVNLEIAVRTRDIPASMQYENQAPMDYFARLISQFETQMASYSKQIEQTESYLAVLGSPGNSITSQDITTAMQKLHLAFTELAAKYYVLHQTVTRQKSEYLQLHRAIHGSGGTIFDGSSRTQHLKTVSHSPLPSLAGPSPFSAPVDPLIQARNSLLLNRSQQTGGPPTLGLGSTVQQGTFGSLGGSNTSFGGSSSQFGTSSPAPNTGFGSSINTTFGGGFVNPQNSTFGSPAPGSKRGKH